MVRIPITSPPHRIAGFWTIANRIVLLDSDYRGRKAYICAWRFLHRRNNTIFNSWVYESRRKRDHALTSPSSFSNQTFIPLYIAYWVFVSLCISFWSSNFNSWCSGSARELPLRPSPPLLAWSLLADTFPSFAGHWNALIWLWEVSLSPSNTLYHRYETASLTDAPNSHRCNWDCWKSCVCSRICKLISSSQILYHS